MNNRCKIITVVQTAWVAGVTVATLTALDAAASTRYDLCPPDIVASAVVYEGYYISNAGTCSISARATMVNLGGAVTNSGYLENFGTAWNRIGMLTNDGTLINRAGAYLYNTGERTVDASGVSVNVSGRLVNRDGAQMANEGGVIANGGDPVAGVGGTLTNTGQGTSLYNYARGILYNRVAGTTLLNESGASLYFFDDAKLINDMGATLINRRANLISYGGGTLINSGEGTKLYNQDHALLYGVGTNLYNQDGATLRNMGDGGLLSIRRLKPPALAGQL